jgi:hypothetical protein
LTIIKNYFPVFSTIPLIENSYWNNNFINFNNIKRQFLTDYWIYTIVQQTTDWNSIKSKLEKKLEQISSNNQRNLSNKKYIKEIENTTKFTIIDKLVYINYEPQELKSVKLDKSDKTKNLYIAKFLYNSLQKELHLMNIISTIDSFEKYQKSNKQIVALDNVINKVVYYKQMPFNITNSIYKMNGINSKLIKPDDEIVSLILQLQTFKKYNDDKSIKKYIAILENKTIPDHSLKRYVSKKNSQFVACFHEQYLLKREFHKLNEFLETIPKYNTQYCKWCGEKIRDSDLDQNPNFDRLGKLDVQNSVMFFNQDDIITSMNNKFMSNYKNNVFNYFIVQVLIKLTDTRKIEFKRLIDYTSMNKLVQGFKIPQEFILKLNSLKKSKTIINYELLFELISLFTEFYYKVWINLVVPELVKNQLFLQKENNTILIKLLTQLFQQIIFDDDEASFSTLIEQDFKNKELKLTENKSITKKIIEKQLISGWGSMTTKNEKLNFIGIDKKLSDVSKKKTTTVTGEHGALFKSFLQSTHLINIKPIETSYLNKTVPTVSSVSSDFSKKENYISCQTNLIHEYNKQSNKMYHDLFTKIYNEYDTLQETTKLFKKKTNLDNKTKFIRCIQKEYKVYTDPLLESYTKKQLNLELIISQNLNYFQQNKNLFNIFYESTTTINKKQYTPIAYESCPTNFPELLKSITPIKDDSDSTEYYKVLLRKMLQKFKTMHTINVNIDDEDIFSYLENKVKQLNELDKKSTMIFYEFISNIKFLDNLNTTMNKNTLLFKQEQQKLKRRYFSTYQQLKHYNSDFNFIFESMRKNEKCKRIEFVKPKSEQKMDFNVYYDITNNTTIDNIKGLFEQLDIQELTRIYTQLLPNDTINDYNLKESHHFNVNMVEINTSEMEEFPSHSTKNKYDNPFLTKMYTEITNYNNTPAYKLNETFVIPLNSSKYKYNDIYHLLSLIDSFHLHVGYIKNKEKVLYKFDSSTPTYSLLKMLIDEQNSDFNTYTHLVDYRQLVNKYNKANYDPQTIFTNISYLFTFELLNNFFNTLILQEPNKFISDLFELDLKDDSFTHYMNIINTIVDIIDKNAINYKKFDFFKEQTDLNKLKNKTIITTTIGEIEVNDDGDVIEDSSDIQELKLLDI